MIGSSCRAREWRAVLLALALIGLPPPPVAAATSEQHIAALERAVLPGIVVKGEDPRGVPLAERMGELGVPAVSIAYFDQGRIEWARAWGYADRERAVLATRDTLFQAGSISKPVAAAAALRLVERGQLPLDTDVNERLTSWRLPDSEFTRTRKVTLRTLLNHTAGTTVWGFPGYERGGAPPPSPVRVLEGRGNTEPVRVFQTPGQAWRYSGGGYTIVQVMLTDVTGVPFADLMQREVLGPAGMRSSTYEQELPDLMRSRAASGYLGDGSHVPGDSHIYPEMAAAGLWTTPSDLARFAIAVQQASAGTGALLSRTTAKLMLTPGQNGHGLGPVISSDGLRFGHGGVDYGFQAELTASIDGGPGVAIMTNSDNGGRLAREIILTLAREYGWRSAPRPEERAAATLPPDALRALTGRYVASSLGLELQLAVRDGTLRMLLGGRERTLVPMSREEFFVRDTGETLTIRSDGDTMIAELPGGERAVRIEP